MSHPVIQGTKLQCDKGTVQTPIQVTSQSSRRIAGKLQATEADKQANSNIIPFGQCKLKPTKGGYLPCSPALTQWQNTPPFTIDHKKILTTDSCCLCATGGKVTPLIDENSRSKSIG
jgi:hypothetical protein